MDDTGEVRVIVVENGEVFDIELEENVIKKMTS